MTNMKRVRVDKYNGEELVPIQIWVNKKNQASLKKRAKKCRRTLQDFLRDELEFIISGVPF